jgi:hypothetical protein
VTAIDCSVAAVTVSVAELLVIDPDTALIVVLPTPAPVASPVALIVATVVDDEPHVAVFVRFCALPSLKVPVAVNCCVAPFAIDGAAGVTVIDCSVAAVPVSVAVFEVTPFIVAVMLVEPMPVTVASPVAAIVAAAVFDEVHVTCVVKFCVVLSLKVPTALYCCVCPFATVADVGVIAIDCSVAAVTVSVAELLVTAPDVALIVALPTPAPVASPVVLIVATVVADELHVAVFVKFCVVPSLKVPVAVNCCVAPFAIDGAAGVTAIDCNVAAVPVSVAMFDVTLFIVAVMFVEPTPVTVARPPAAIVAAAVFEDVHVTCVVRFCVELSLKVPTALYCCV